MIFNIVVGILIVLCIGGYIAITMYQKKKKVSVGGSKLPKKNDKLEKMVQKEEAAQAKSSMKDEEAEDELDEDE